MIWFSSEIWNTTFTTYRHKTNIRQKNDTQNVISQTEQNNIVLDNCEYAI